MTATLYYPDLEVGRVYVSPGRTVTEADLTMFSMISGDWHPMHSDAEYARTTAFGQRVVHGAFGIALVTGMFGRIGIFEGSALALLNVEGWSFKGPILVGDTLHVELEIAGKRLTSKGDRGIVERRIRLKNQNGAVVQEGRMDMMIRLAPEGTEV